jgi:hypothetical protein
MKLERKADMSASISSSRKFGSISESRLALYGVAAGAALAAGVSQADANLITLDLTGLALSARTSTFSSSLFFDVNATSAATAVGFANFVGADFRLNNFSNGGPKADIANAGAGNQIAADTFGLFINAHRFAGGDSVGPANNFALSSNAPKIAGNFLTVPGGEFAPGDTGYLGLRFTIGTETHYGWANISLNTDYTVELNTLGYESDADTAARISAAVPDQGSSLALLAIGAAGIAALRSRQRKAA